MQTYGEYFKALREASRMTLREVERLSGISNAYLSQLESDKVKHPSPLTLHKLSEIYGVSYEVMMEKVGYPVPGRSEKKPDSMAKLSIAQRIGEITNEEELELLNYLKFIRSRKK